MVHGADENNGRANFIAKNPGTVQFFILAVAIYLIFYFAYNYFVLDSNLHRLYMEFCGESASSLLSALGFENQIVHAAQSVPLGSSIRSSLGANFLIDKASDASPILFVSIAGLLAWPGKSPLKALAVIAGLGLIVSLNIARLACLFFADLYFPLYFEIINNYALPLALVLFTIGFFFACIRLLATHPNK